MSDARKEKVIELRNTIFSAADGLTLDETMQAIAMAQSKIVAATVKGDEFAMMSVLAEYRDIQDRAVPIYCQSEKQ